ncbi:substrate-binding domain-containing protein [Labrys wisconsinensis]|uniref:Simple sugar transport system substrate-binding protein n=1 Tax=Labrys wisconsinensis TaxID=425677 RepID=A0ABU0IYH2_9HYPH|nr:substrate-binding domain-containing protein [Labrys wisconsinensis]MDQ0467064.1 simple sugar transport system substrate-binding protein [Labrys wisconsinensis]
MRLLKASLLGLSVLASMSAAARAADDLVVGVTYLDAQGFYAGVRKGVQVGGTELGKNLQIIETNVAADVAKEASFIDRLVSAGAQVIVVSAVSPEGSVKAIKRANEAGVPVVCYNTCIREDDMKKYVYAYAVGDPFTFGYKIGQVAAADFEKAGKKEPKIAILNCEFVDVCVQRRKGFEKALGEKVPGYKIVANQEATILDKAITTGEKIITANPDIDAFWGESGGASLGAAKAIRNQGKAGTMVAYGSDMTTEIAQEIVAGDVMRATVDVSGQALGKLALTQAVNAVEKKPQGALIVPNPVDLYTSADQARAWLAAHPDGLP